MCGIVGIVSHTPVTQRLIEGLQSLEYRGYDSTGIATLEAGHLKMRRAKGKLIELRTLLDNDPIQGTTGIGHTRWATHGIPSHKNAHPQMTSKVAVVHNGIIENHAILKDKLTKEGHVFHSDTDTEVIAQLLTFHLKQGQPPLIAFRETLASLKGAYALAVLFDQQDHVMMVARSGSPLVIGYGKNEMVIGSDALAVSPWTQDLAYLEDGDYAILTPQSVEIFDDNHFPVQRAIQKSYVNNQAISKGKFKHFMLKEIFEQPEAITNTLTSLVQNGQWTEGFTKSLNLNWHQVSKLTIVACGTSFYAGQVAKYWFEKLARLPVEVDIASEFRYRNPVLHDQGVVLFISQSGETIDTLMALQHCQTHGQNTIALVNVPESSMARTADHVLFTQAGPEIGVASTKAFTCQLTALLCLALHAAQARGQLSSSQQQQFVTQAHDLPTFIRQVLHQDHRIDELTHLMEHAPLALFLGRGTSHPIAMEGALKLKEISYIPAEGYAAGEMKHGPIALIDSRVPVIMLAPHDQWLHKTLSNIQEVMARGAQVICVCDQRDIEIIQADAPGAYLLAMPEVPELLTPIVYSVVMQLLAYHTALRKGTDVDQPRNLAKSVTVE